MLDQLFLAHPRTVDESYPQHRRAAWAFSASLLKAAAACFIHGLVPALFESTASQTVEALHERMVSTRMRRLPYRAASIPKASQGTAHK